MFTKLKELNAAFVLTPKKYPLFRFSEEQKKIKRKGSLMKVISLHWTSSFLLISQSQRARCTYRGHPDLNWGTSWSAVKCSTTELYPLPLATIPIKARMKLLEIIWPCQLKCKKILHPKKVEQHPDRLTSLPRLTKLNSAFVFITKKHQLFWSHQWSCGSEQDKMEMQMQSHEDLESPLEMLFFCWFQEARVSNFRGHPDLNWGPLDLQSNALPLSYTPCCPTV